MSPRRFALVLGMLTLLGFALRVIYGLSIGGGDTVGDDTWYHEAANNLANGLGFIDPFSSLEHGHRVFGLQGEHLPTAAHLPAFPFLLAFFSKLGITSYSAQQVIGCALGAGTVPLVGLVARRLWDPRAGVAAAGIATIYPPLIANDSVMMSESLFGVLVALVLLLTLRLRERPSAGRAIALGAALAAGALTRQETFLLALLLLVWVAKRARPRDAVVAAVTIALLCAPWAIRNTLTFDQPVLLTTVDGSVFAGANGPTTYGGGALGGWDFNHAFGTPVGRTVVPNEAKQSTRWRKEAFDYARDHASRLPIVLGARVLRTWGFYPFDPRTRARYVAFIQERHRWVELAAWPCLLIVLALALAGGVALRRRGGPVWLLVAPCILITIVSVVSYGDPRFAQAGNVALVIAAGVGALALWEERAALRERLAASWPRSRAARGAPAP